MNYLYKGIYSPRALMNYDSIYQLNSHKVFIWGLTDTSKLVFAKLTEINIAVEGFVLPEVSLDTRKVRYFGKQIYSLDKIRELANPIIIQTNNRENISKILPLKVPVIRLWEDKVVILLGKSSCVLNEAKNSLIKCGVTIRTVEDSLNDLIGIKNYDIVLMPNESIDEYDVFLRPLLFRGLNYYIWKKDEFSFQTIGGSKNTYLNYIYHKQHFNHNKLILCGSRKNIYDKCHFLENLSINVTEGISIERIIGIENGIEYISPYDLFYMDIAHTVVLVLPEAEAFIKDFLMESGISSEIFIRYIDIRRVYSPVCFDPNLGYNIKNSVEHIKLHGKNTNKRTLRIGILGGSTSDSTYFYEKSWPQWLCEISESHKITMEIFSGGVRGYTASLELVKLIRDMVGLGLDFIISYSGINESSAGIIQNPFISYYQRDIFECFAASKPDGIRRDMENEVCYGISNRSFAENWVVQQRMMRAVCKEFGIKFISVLQPWLLEKKELSKYDSDIIELWYSENKAFRFETMKKIKKLISTEEYSWINDFSNMFDKINEPIYFDGCHLYSKGNYFVASKIFDLIMEELR